MDSRYVEHRVALREFVECALALDADTWQRSPAGKWSPAQISQHLSLTYAALLQEMAGGSAIRVRTSAWQRLFLRWTVLPGLLKHGRIPTGAPAVREVRPGNGPFDQKEVLDRLEAQCEKFLEVLGDQQRSGKAQLTHPFFGKLDSDAGLRFCTVHIIHHRRQLPSAEKNVVAF
ncbi:MAG: DinB family protein [Gemmatimonadaceae bacterium]